MDTLTVCILALTLARAAAFTKEARTGALHIPEKILGGVIEIVHSHKNKPLAYQGQPYQYGQAAQGQFQLQGQGQYASGYQHGYNQASLANQGVGQAYPAQSFQGQTGYQNGLNAQNQASGQYQLGGALAWNQNNQYQQANQVPLQGTQGQYVAGPGPQYQGGPIDQSNQNQAGQYNPNQNAQFVQNQNGQFSQNVNGQFAQNQNGQFIQNQNGQYLQNQNGQYAQNQFQNGQYGQNVPSGQFPQGPGAGQPVCVCQAWTKPQADDPDAPLKVKQDLNVIE